MLSVALDKIILVLCSFALLSRLLLEPFLTTNFDALGGEHIATLINDLVLFIITFIFILKKTALQENIRFPKVFGPLALFSIAVSLSIFYSIDAPSSMLYMFDLWASFFLMLVLVNLLSSVQFIEIILVVLVALMVLASTNAAYEYLVVLPKVLERIPNVIPGASRGFLQLLSSHRTPTLFGWPNILAGFLAMTIPLTTSYFAPMRPLFVKVLAGSAMLIALYALFVTMTVSSWIALLAGASIFFLSLKKTRLNTGKRIWVFLIVSLIAIIIAFTAFKKTTMPGVNSTDARWQYFISSFFLIKLHPFLGSGWRSYGIASATYIKNINGRSFFAHNSYLQIWAELGTLSLIVFFNFLWSLWKNALALMHECHRKNRWLASAIAAGIVGCMVDNLFSYTMIKPQVALFWWVLCALLIALKENLEPSDCIMKAQTTWKKLFLVMTIAGGIMTMRLTLAEYDFFTAVHDIHLGTQYAKADLLCREAKGLAPWDKKFGLARAYALYGSFTQTRDVRTLQLARDAALSTEGQISLNSEREAILKMIYLSPHGPQPVQ